MTDRVHIIGIGGAGMSGLARVLAGQGYRVSGCDTNFSPVLQSLDDEGIAVFAEHDARHVEDTDLLLWSPAVASDNPERVRAAELGVATLDRASMLAKLGNDLLSPVQHVGHVFLIVVINRPEMLGFGRGKRKMVRH